ncbi:hypothetical protein LEP1GSC115_4844 [Leptospira interrogans serovar Australis str. 200703203]|uniref:Uncharacterized protein n=1 Tax=Leptospira interrogans serovar Australis str. 200703203 TaxID=1085541 RepID=N1UM09_LEPIR|nr:hypothetical protein LEP1GSC115_4844 [Leptospira interrogans serovar Australis str. 200703203]
MEEPIHAQFLVDEKGEKSSALLPIEEYNAILNNVLELQRINDLLFRFVAAHDISKFSKEFQNEFEKYLQTSKLVHSSSSKFEKEILEALKTLSNLGTEISRQKEPTKEEILEGIKQGFKEANLIREGKLKAKSMDQLLDEL